MSMSGTLSNGGVPKNPTFGTVIATSALKLGAGATFDLYNTADQTTNYERLRASFVSNRAEVGTFFAGTGTPRQMRVGAGNASTLSSFLGFYSQQFPFVEAVIPNTAGGGVLVELFKGTFTGSLGTQTIASIQPTFNQSGTAGYTAFDINPTETATGSGTKLLQRWAVGGSAKAQLSNTGVFGTSGLLAGSSSTIGFSSDFTLVGQDVALARDAADTLALRRSTNAQTFRVYNTYTDASNYRRWNLSWNTTTAIMQVVGAGTGTNGNLAVGNAALATTATVGYFMIPSSAGAPTGVPADIPTGQVALHFDSTNNKLYVYDGGWLSTAALT